LKQLRKLEIVPNSINLETQSWIFIFFIYFSFFKINPNVINYLYFIEQLFQRKVNILKSVSSSLDSKFKNKLFLFH